MPHRKINGIELNFLDQGQGQPLLFVHGFPLDHSMWQSQIDEFAKDFRVIAPDLRGFGESEVADNVSMEQIADDLAALLDDLSIETPVTFCGLSMGGYVAWQFWRRHPQRLGKLILCDTRAIADSREAALGRLDTADRVLAEGPAFLADAMLEKLFAPSTLADDAPCVSATRETILQTAPAGIAAALHGMAGRPDVTNWLPEIDLPTLVICGEHDAISTVDEMRGIADSIANAEFVFVPDAGHMAPLENPEVVNTAIRRFLDGPPK